VGKLEKHRMAIKNLFKFFYDVFLDKNQAFKFIKV
jgi:hypothetical protein